MKYTAQQLKRSLTKSITETLSKHNVNKYNREYQFWKRETLSIELISPAVFGLTSRFEEHLSGGKQQDTVKDLLSAFLLKSDLQKNLTTVK